MLDDRTRPLKARLEDQPITPSRWCRPSSGACWRGFDPARTRVRELLLGAPPSRRPLVNRLTALGLEPKVSYGLRDGQPGLHGQPCAAGVVGRPLPGREVCIRQGRSACAVGPCLPAISGEGELGAPDEEGWFHPGQGPPHRGAIWWWRAARQPLHLGRENIQPRP